jgi:hypothetical protein
MMPMVNCGVRTPYGDAASSVSGAMHHDSRQIVVLSYRLSFDMFDTVATRKLEQSDLRPDSVQNPLPLVEMGASQRDPRLLDGVESGFHRRK